MKEMTNAEFKISAARELLAIGVLKIVVVLLTFTFATVITETIKIYAWEADGWIRDRSEAVSRNIKNLYR